MVNKFDDDEHQDVEKSIRMTEDRDKREKVRPWCGQPSDRGRLQNSTERTFRTQGCLGEI